MLGKDYYPMRVYQSNFIIDEDKLSFIVTDEDNNLHMMAYNPFSKILFMILGVLSLGGQKLISSGQLHKGSDTMKSKRFNMIQKSRIQQGCVLGNIFRFFNN